MIEEFLLSGILITFLVQLITFYYQLITFLVQYVLLSSMLETLIPSKTRVSLLTLFLLNPGQKYYIREISRKISDNYPSVRKELANLEGFGLLLSEKKGNQIYFFVNTDFFLYEDLQRLILKTEGVTKTLIDDLNDSGLRYNIQYLFIYGSFASGKANTKSDIDLFVVGDINENLPGRNRFIEKIGKIEERIGREINYTIFSERELLTRIQNNDPFITNVMNKPKIWITGKNEFENVRKQGID